VPHPISVESRRRGLSVRLWVGESFRYASVDSLDMSWLPLPRFESRAVRAAVSCRERGARAIGRGFHTQYPMEVSAEVYR
jgi:hypothetical protein